MTITHDVLDLTVQGTSDPSPAPLPTGTVGLSPLPVISGGQDWRPVQTCSLEDPPSVTDIRWLSTEACTVYMQVVCILLECFLVLIKGLLVTRQIDLIDRSPVYSLIFQSFYYNPQRSTRLGVVCQNFL